SPPSAVAYIIGLPHPARCIIAIGEKTAEERFNMLALGWLAYLVASMHSHLPPKSGCICQHIPRFANNLSNRHSAVAYIIKKNALINALRQLSLSYFPDNNIFVFSAKTLILHLRN
uniref:hypothetical protein n=1 Tax=Candidatus Limisoma sp. TaxID=3076476 RepID=UPI003FF02331